MKALKTAKKSAYNLSIVALTLGLSTEVYAGMLNNGIHCMSETLATYTLDCGHWYVGGNIGISHLYDRKAPGSLNSVNQNGPGFNVNGGYQFNSILGAELGFTHYHASRETIGATFGSVTIAQTEHYSAYLAATGRYPLFYKISALGKLGVAYNYANKIFNTGPSASANSVSAYYGLGFAYSVTCKVDMIAQWARARGNNSTGSADLYSLGIQAAIV